MSRSYAVNGPNASGTANKSATTIVASSSVRPRLYEFNVGISTAPNTTDQQFQYAVGRFTVAGTAGSSPTPLPVDPADVAATATAGITHSAEPTYTAGGSLIQQWINQRGGFRWVAVPGEEWMAPATAANGLGLYLVSIANAAVIQGQMLWRE